MIQTEMSTSHRSPATNAMNTSASRSSVQQRCLMHLASRSDQASNEAHSSAALRLDSAAVINRRLSRMHGLFIQVLSNRAATVVVRQHRHLMAATASAP